MMLQANHRILDADAFPLKAVAPAFLAGAVYFAAVLVGTTLLRLPGDVAGIWIANALALTFLMRQNRRDWLFTLPAIFLAGFIAYVAVGDGVPTGAALMAANALEILVAASVIRVWYGPDFRFDNDLGAYFKVLAVAALLAPMLGAAIGASAVTAVQGGTFGTVTASWWSASAIGAIAVLPLILSATPAMMRDAFAGRNTQVFGGAAVAAVVIAYGAVALLPYPFVAVALVLAAAAMVLNPFATAAVSALGLLAAIAAGLAGDALGISAEIAFTQTFFHVFAALSIVLPFAISLLVTRLRSDRAQIAESEERFRSAMENSAIGVSLVGLDGTWIRVNPATCDLLGYSPEELMALTFQDLTHPDDLEADVDLVRRCIAGEIDSYRMEKRYICKDGSIVWALLVVAIIRDQQTHRPLYFVSQIEDITARKEADAKLAASEQRWKFALDGGQQGVWDYDARTGKKYISPTFWRMLGYEPASFGGDSEAWKTLVHPDDLPLVLEADQQHIAGATAFVEVEMRMRHRNGSWVWMLDRAKVIERDADGQPLRMIGTHTDITRLKETEAALVASESRWSFAMEGARQGVWDVDLTTNETYYSPMWKALIGYKDDEFGDDPSLWLDYIHPDDRQRVVEADKKHLAGAVDAIENEFRMRHKDGHWVWILDRGKVIGRGEDGRPLRLIGTHTDITAQKASEERMRVLSDRMSRAAKAGKVGLWEIDPGTGDVWWDEGNHLVHGTDPARFRPADLETIIHPDERDTFRADHAEILAGEAVLNRGYRIVAPDGSIRHIRSSREFLRDESGAVTGAVGANWDVTQETALNEALSEEKERLRVTLESIGDAVICTDRAQRITFMNPTAACLTGWDATEAIGRPVETVFRIVDEMSGEPLPGPVGECLRTLTPVSATEGIQLVDRTGARIDIRDTVAPVKTEDADVIGTVVVFQDTTRERKLQRQIAHSAAHDSLTKLRNRVSFETDLAEACREVSEEGRTHCVCFIDLDAFKPVNDEAGHAAGDALLQDIGATIRAGVRGHDVTARLGGDEFGLLLRDCPAEQAAVIADKMIRSINDAEFEWEGRSFRVGASVGVREIPRHATSFEVLKDADLACYEAKARGRNRVHIFGNEPPIVAAAS